MRRCWSGLERSTLLVLDSGLDVVDDDDLACEGLNECLHAATQMEMKCIWILESVHLRATYRRRSSAIGQKGGWSGRVSADSTRNVRLFDKPFFVLNFSRDIIVR